MAKRKKKSSWVKPVLIIGGVAVGVLFGLPVLMNYLRPKGEVNPTLPYEQPQVTSSVPVYSARIMGLI
jgi:hypothetical protein